VKTFVGSGDNTSIFWLIPPPLFHDFCIRFLSGGGSGDIGGILRVMAGYCSYKKVELSRLPLYSSISPAHIQSSLSGCHMKIDSKLFNRRQYIQNYWQKV
jgi:hypothetical protein